jgi:2-polyprenyl-3-methyl-5-hydroxy-6-metoxy-1,4-benzoquinol methylase
MNRSNSDKVNEKIVQSWRDNAMNWTNAVRSQHIESRRLVTDQIILDTIVKYSGLTILDVGCGEGWLSRKLVESGRVVTGFDASTELIQEAQSSRVAEYLVMSYAEFAAKPQRAGKIFDGAVCNFSLLEENLSPVLTALKQVIKPSGHLFIQTIHPVVAAAAFPYTDGWREECFETLPGKWVPMPWYFRTISSWIRVLTKSGWTIRECIEPLHPSTGKPASIVFIAVR